MLEKCRVPLLMAECDARQVALTVWGVDRDHPEVVKFSADHPALAGRVAVTIVRNTMLLGDITSKSIDDRERFLLAKNGRAAVAGFVGAVPKLFVLRQVNLRLPLLSLGFLQADDIRVIRFDKSGKLTLFYDGADAVDVPGK